MLKKEGLACGVQETLSDRVRLLNSLLVNVMQNLAVCVVFWCSTEWKYDRSQRSGN